MEMIDPLVSVFFHSYETTHFESDPRGRIINLAYTVLRDEYAILPAKRLTTKQVLAIQPSF